MTPAAIRALDIDAGLTRLGFVRLPAEEAIVYERGDVIVQRYDGDVTVTVHEAGTRLHWVWRGIFSAGTPAGVVLGTVQHTLDDLEAVGIVPETARSAS